jgi:serine/threonine protein phosphatase PrpC
VWLKGKELPGLAISRSIGDDLAHHVGVSSEPGIKYHIHSISLDVKVVQLDRKRNQYALVLATDGVWNVMGPVSIKTFVKDALSTGDNVNESPSSKRKEPVTMQNMSQLLAKEALENWNKVKFFERG